MLYKKGQNGHIFGFSEIVKIFELNGSIGFFAKKFEFRE